MTIGAALLLIAVGAILRFAVNTVTVWGIQVHTIGDILMIVGVVGLVLWMVIWAPWARARRTTVAAVSQAGTGIADWSTISPAHSRRRACRPCPRIGCGKWCGASW